MGTQHSSPSPEMFHFQTRHKKLFTRTQDVLQTQQTVNIEKPVCSFSSPRVIIRTAWVTHAKWQCWGGSHRRMHAGTRGAGVLSAARPGSRPGPTLPPSPTSWAGNKVFESCTHFCPWIQDMSRGLNPYSGSSHFCLVLRITLRGKCYY